MQEATEANERKRKKERRRRAMRSRMGVESLGVVFLIEFGDEGGVRGCPAGFWLCRFYFDILLLLLR